MQMYCGRVSPTVNVFILYCAYRAICDSRMPVVTRLHFIQMKGKETDVACPQAGKTPATAM